MATQKQIFTESGSWTVPDGVSQVDVFLVGGGGGGAASVGGGGGGGYTATHKGIAVSPGDVWTVEVGSGGAGGVGGGVNAGGDGGSSKFSLDALIYEALGGKGGASDGTRNGGDGGSGGGGGAHRDGSTHGGDGGSDGEDGQDSYYLGGTGQGTATREFGDPTGALYGGGGGGGADDRNTAAHNGGLGGDGGGGDGAGNNNSYISTPGAANTGGGGGAGAFKSLSHLAGSDGGSGIVIIRWEEASADGPWLTGWAKRRKITLDSSKIDSDLTHFPVPVPIGPAVGLTDADVSGIFDEVGPDYLKIAVTKGDAETQIYVEVEQWDEVNGRALLWVSKSDLVLTSESDPEIYVYYDAGQPDNVAYVGTPGNRPEVWSSDFAAVYTMAQDPTGGAGCIIDSTGNGNNGTPYGSMTSGNLVGAPVGQAIKFNGVDDYIHIPAASSLNVGSSLTLIYGVKPDWDNSTYTPFIAKNNTDGDTDYMTWVGDDKGFDFETAESSLKPIYDVSADMFSGVWSRVGIVIDADNIELFIDGGSKAIDSVNMTTIHNSPLYLGRHPSASDSSLYGAGSLSDVRITNVPLTSSWIKADYHAQTDNLITWGAEELEGSAGEEVPLVQFFMFPF